MIKDKKSENRGILDFAINANENGQRGERATMVQTKIKAVV